MKILFVENRYKTYFYEAIAKQLQKKGHEINWLIQNHDFAPNSQSNKYLIPYPQNKVDYVADSEIEQIIQSDRQINHFEKKDNSYFYYYDREIKRILLDYKPKLVFGESTAFHELVTIKNARDQKILYLNPSTTRYPIGRFSFYKYDTLVPYLGSEELLTNKEAKAVIDSIVNKSVVPDYMRSQPVSKMKNLRDSIVKISAYIRGERFNTPHPLIKYKIEKEKDRNIALWDKNAVCELREGGFMVLYPLQMQPEANLDVWGRKYRNQTKLIKNLAANLPKDAILYVKPNPKSKYELTPELIDLVKETPNIIRLHHKVPMDVVFPEIDLVVTVTGTIAMESILSNKPLIRLTKTIVNESRNAVYLTKLSSIGEQIEMIKNNTFPVITENEKIAYINLLNSTSYAGIISDPHTNQYSTNKENVDIIVNHFEDVMQSV